MTPQERDDIVAAAHAEAAAAPPLTPQQRNRLNTLTRAAVQAVARKYEESHRAQVSRNARRNRARGNRPT